MSFNELKKHILGDIIDIKHGFAFKGEFFSQTETEDVLLSPGNFKIGGGFKDDKFKYYNGNYPKEYILKENDIIVTMTDLSKEGDTLGYSAKIPFSDRKKYLHNQRLGLVQFKSEEFDKDYIYWLLRTREYQLFIVNSATGTTVKHTAPTRIKEYEFLAPNKTTQTKIANILSSLDEKIELNRQTNQTLETVAQTLFKEICLPKSDVLPNGWKVGKLSEVVNINMGQSPSGSSFNQDGNGVVFFQGKAEFGFRFPTIDKYTTEPKKYANKFDTLLSVRAPVGTVNIATEKCSIGRGLAAISGFNETWSFAFHLLKSLSTKFEMYNGEGTVFGSINRTDLENIEIVIPSKETINSFELVGKSLDELVYKNEKETQTLITLRDSLLPKLMKGEISLDSSNK
jgi:type I restriction enzyme S subunit